MGQLSGIFFGHNLLAPLSLPNSPISEGLPSRLGINSVFSVISPISEGLTLVKGSKHITPKNARQNDFSLKKKHDNLPFFEITRILYKM